MNAIASAAAGRNASSHAGNRVQRMRWLLRREFWEHRGGLFWAPLIASALFLLFTLIGGGTGQYLFERNSDTVVTIDGKDMSLGEVNWGDALSKASPGDLQHLNEAINGITLTSAMWPLLVFGVVVFFYLVGSLYDERKDRSVLFWKSLPVSDAETVLSKLLMALVAGPLLAVGIAIATMLGFGIVLSLFIAINGANPFTLYWAQLDPGLLLVAMLGWIPAYVLWALPTAGWLMLCSAWARSKPFLWALALPIGAGVLVSWFGLFKVYEDGGAWFWEHVVLRVLISAWPGSHLMGLVDSGHFDRLEGSASALFALDGPVVGSGLLAQPAIWVGALAGVLMLLAAIRLRRWRDDG